MLFETSLPPTPIISIPPFTPKIMISPNSILIPYWVSLIFLVPFFKSQLGKSPIFIELKFWEWVRSRGYIYGHIYFHIFFTLQKKDLF